MIVFCVLENYFPEEDIGIISEVGDKMPQAHLKLFYLFVLLSNCLDIMVKLKQLHCFPSGYSGQWALRSCGGKMLQFSKWPTGHEGQRVPGREPHSG